MEKSAGLPKQDRPPKPGADVGRLKPSGRQNALEKALADQSHEVATMYRGALTVLEDVDNPDRLALAAHGMRELMDRLPEYVNVETRVLKESLTGKVRELRDLWGSACDNSRCHEGGIWDGSIDKHLTKLLDKMARFFEWFDKHRPSRRAVFAAATRALDGSGHRLPPPIEEHKARAWGSFKSFFEAVAHHGRKVEAEEFRKQQEGLEDFLFEILMPRTFDDMSEIDRIIREGEGDAQR